MDATSEDALLHEVTNYLKSREGVLSDSWMVRAAEVVKIVRAGAAPPAAPDGCMICGKPAICPDCRRAGRALPEVQETIRRAYEATFPFDEGDKS
jgi:hypothetical protein